MPSSNRPSTALLDASVLRKGRALGRRRARPGEARAWRVASRLAVAASTWFDDRYPPHAHELVQTWRWSLRHKRRWLYVWGPREIGRRHLRGRDVLGGRV